MYKLDCNVLFAILKFKYNKMCFHLSYISFIIPKIGNYPASKGKTNKQKAENEQWSVKFKVNDYV